ncbi:glycerophosphodiester phosphodiesterase family protein [Oceanospirillaceae bacterium]|nr:glycerophosphodiester phosphodiesterase family protein [Oceanospirillaceae bacterium]
MQLFAHRGTSDLAPENTMEAFKLALHQQCDGIELDVRLMSGAVVVMHDSTVNRTTSGKGLVNQFTPLTWQRLDAGDGQPPPSLRQVLELVRGVCAVNIELKSGDLIHQVANEIKHAVGQLNFEWAQLCVSAFDHRLLVELKVLLPALNIAPLIASCPVSLAFLAHDMGADALHSYTETTDAQLVDDAHARGLLVRVYTVKEAKELLRLKHLGVDAVFVNDIAWARQVLSLSD